MLNDDGEVASHWWREEGWVYIRELLLLLFLFSFPSSAGRFNGVELFSFFLETGL